MNTFKKVIKFIYQFYTWGFYVPFFFLYTIVFGILAVVFSLLINQRAGSYIGGVIWSRLSALLIPMIPKVRGKENIEKNTSYIIMTNHQSFYDIFLVYGWIGLDIKWIMKKELRKIPGLGWGSVKVGHIFLDRSNNRAALESLAAAKEKLVNGTSVVIFPEGTRSKTGIPGSFKRGGFKLAIDLKLPILPVTLKGTRKILPADILVQFPGKVEMIIHEPVSIDGYSEKNIRELMDLTKEKICSDLDQ
ncbi:MAG: 1-acyl-sn-glycerol-3-phosphate acyltransferase [Bacteroidales bacterium]|nr:1-acyl-sn-glycerol-3-phosphate acyltransferase [Bacteroidales bacterium]